MSKKQARNKKMAQVEASLAEQKASIPTGPKTLVLTPQIPVCLQGQFPDQQLYIERPNQSGSRHKVLLTQDNAYKILLEVLTEKAGEIELERAQVEARGLKARAKARNRAQPDWITIARHPEVVIIEKLPTKASQLKSNKAELNLEDMGL